MPVLVKRPAISRSSSTVSQRSFVSLEYSNPLSRGRPPSTSRSGQSASMSMLQYQLARKVMKGWPLCMPVSVTRSAASVPGAIVPPPSPGTSIGFVAQAVSA